MVIALSMVCIGLALLVFTIWIALAETIRRANKIESELAVTRQFVTELLSLYRVMDKSTVKKSDIAQEYQKNIFALNVDTKRRIYCELVKAANEERGYVNVSLPV
jgi:hypothetical protein